MKVKFDSGQPTINELEKSTIYTIAEMIDYVPDAILSKTILKRATGNVSVMAFDSGEGLTEKTVPFDTFVQILDGNAEIVIDNKSNRLRPGEGIIIPAHSSNFIKPNGRFKLIMTTIKSGYE